MADLEQRLTRLKPFVDLGPGARDTLLQHARVLPVKPGVKLHARDEYQHLVFLLDGRVVVVRDQAHPLSITSDSPEALEPLFGAHDFHGHAAVVTPGELVLFDRRLYENLLEGRRGDIEVGELEFSDTETELFSTIYHKIHTGEPSLPQLPEVALRLQKAIKDPNVDLATITRIVEQDPSVAARLLAVANSPAMGSQRVVKRLGDAIARLGIERTRQLVLALAMHQVFVDPKHPAHAILEDTWERSVRVAAISGMLAEQSEAADPQSALLAGLLHRVGALPVLGELMAEGVELEPGQIEGMLFRLEGLVGELVAAQWGLASDIIEAIRDSGGPETERAGTLTDIVRIARSACAHDSGHDERTGVAPLNQLHAVQRLGFALDENGWLPVIDTARQQIDALIRDVA